MPPQPLVSIITPSYNQAQFIEKTICSVLDQDYPNIEYLVVDGGSDDGTVEIIKHYQSKLAWWVSEKDSGQAEAINKGFTRARGEFVAWINSDDYLMPGAVAGAVEALLEHPDAAFVFGDVRVVEQNGTILNQLAYGQWGLADLMAFRIIGQPAVFMRRSVLEKTGFLDLSYHLLLDHHLWIRLATIGSMVYVPSLWAGAHYHEGCKNLSMAAGFGSEAHRIVDWMRQSPKYASLFRKNKERILAGAERLNAFYLVDAKEYSKSFRAYWKAFWFHPATVLPEWRRMVYAFFAPLGLEGVKRGYIERRRKKLNHLD